MWCRLTKTQTKIGNENGSWGAWVRDSVSVSCAWRGGIHIIPTLYITQSFFSEKATVWVVVCVALQIPLGVVCYNKVQTQVRLRLERV